jgi:hypothetical protein
MIVDNPAARLLDILKTGKAHQDNESCKDVWLQILNVEPGDNPLLWARISQVMALPNDIAEEMREHYPDEAQMVAHWRGQVNKAFATLSLSASWQSFNQHIDVHTINYLSTTAKLLQYAIKIKPIVKEDLAGAREKVDEALKEVINSSADDDIKLTLSRYLRAILTAIDEYFITGALPIIDAINSTFGNVVIDPKYREFLKSDPLGQKVANTISLVANVVTIAVSLPQLTSAFAAGLALLTGSHS